MKDEEILLGVLIVALLALALFSTPDLMYISSQKTSNCQWTVDYGVNQQDLLALGCTGEKITTTFSIDLVAPSGYRKTVYANTGSGSIPGKIMTCGKIYDYGYTIYASDRYYLPKNESGNWKVEFNAVNAYDSTKKFSQSTTFNVPESCIASTTPKCAVNTYQTAQCWDGSTINLKRCTNNGEWFTLNEKCPVQQEFGCGVCKSNEFCDPTIQACVVRQSPPPLPVSNPTPVVTPSTQPTIQPSIEPEVEDSQDNSFMVLGVIGGVLIGLYYVLRVRK